MKYVRRLYYACPSEVVSVLLDLMELDAAGFESSDMQETDSLSVNHSSDTQLSISDMKTIILKLSEKEPRLLLSVLKSVIEMIDAKEDLADKGIKHHTYPFCRHYSGIFYTLFHELLHNV
jgi:ribosomal biogenesis protein LAS1